MIVNKIIATTFVVVSTLAATCLYSQSAEKADNQFEVLFDGTSLDNFRGYKTEKIGEGWKIEDKVLMFTGSNGGDIITKKEYENFELQFDWMVSEGANSGVMYRVTQGDGVPYLSGPEFQILDDSKHQDGRSPLTSAGSLYGLYSPEAKSLKPVNEWNSAKIVIMGDKVEHWLNGKKVVSAKFGSEDWKSRVADSKFKDWKKFAASKSGHIAFQDHGSRVWFRDIKIKSLK